MTKEPWNKHTPAEPQVLEMLSAATDDDAAAIRRAARRANIAVPG